MLHADFWSCYASALSCRFPRWECTICHTDSEGQGNTEGECWSGTTRNRATSKCIDLEIPSREIYPAHFFLTSLLSHCCKKRHFFHSIFCHCYILDGVNEEESQMNLLFISLYLCLWSVSSRLCIWAVQFRKHSYIHLFTMQFGWFCWKCQSFHWYTSRDLIFSQDSHTINILAFDITTIFPGFKKNYYYFILLSPGACYKPKIMLVTKYQWCSCHEKVLRTYFL